MHHQVLNPARCAAQIQLPSDSPPEPIPSPCWHALPPTVLAQRRPLRPVAARDLRWLQGRCDPNLARRPVNQATSAQRLLWGLQGGSRAPSRKGAQGPAFECYDFLEILFRLLKSTFVRTL